MIYIVFNTSNYAVDSEDAIDDLLTYLKKQYFVSAEKEKILFYLKSESICEITQSETLGNSLNYDIYLPTSFRVVDANQGTTLIAFRGTHNELAECVTTLEELVKPYEHLNLSETEYKSLLQTLVQDIVKSKSLSLELM